MKKLFIAALLAFGFSFSISAQQSKKDVELGLNVGYNRSTIVNSQNTANAGSGFNFGASAYYYFSNRWSLKGKLIYDQKGWNNDYIRDNATGILYNTNYKVNYLTVPVMANWHFGSKRNWYLNFGPYAGFLLNAKDTRFETDVKKDFNSTDFGLALGIGVKIPVSDKAKFFVEYEEEGGFSDIFIPNSGSAFRNSRASFNMGFVFLLDTKLKQK